MESAVFRKLDYDTAYRFRLTGKPGTNRIVPSGEEQFVLPARLAGRMWRVPEPETRVQAWEPVWVCQDDPGCMVSFPFDVVANVPVKGNQTFTRVSDPVPAPETMKVHEIWRRHFSWLRMVDPVRGGIPDPKRAPDRLFVNLFHPEPFTGEPWAGNPAELLAAIGTWQGLWDHPVPVTLLVTGDMAPWKGPWELSYSLELADCPDRYPAHHPGMLLSRNWYPYGFEKAHYAWTDTDTLQLFHAAVMREPQSFRIPVVVTGCAEDGVMEALPWCKPDVSALGVPADALVVSGGILTGREGGDEPVLAPWDRGFAALKRSGHRSFLWFLNPGVRADSASFLFASRYLPKLSRELGADLRGEPRFCIACNQCEIHCPVGLDPQILWKFLRADLVDEALKSGLLRCIECGLCSYTCPSKIELLNTFAQARSALRKKRAK